MIGPNAMSEKIDAPDALLSAIADFRMELLDWIDTELARLREHEPAEEWLIQEERAGAKGSACSGSSSRHAVRNGTPETQPPAANPRQRLDALARLLDHRLKHAQEAAEANGGTGGFSARVENDSS
jgi:hypothetical protein